MSPPALLSTPQPRRETEDPEKPCPHAPRKCCSGFPGRRPHLCQPLRQEMRPLPHSPLLLALRTPAPVGPPHLMLATSWRGRRHATGSGSAYPPGRGVGAGWGGGVDQCSGSRASGSVGMWGPWGAAGERSQRVSEGLTEVLGAGGCGTPCSGCGVRGGSGVVLRPAFAELA